MAVDGERDADGGELLHGLLLQGLGVILAAHTDHGLAVVSLAAKAQLVGHQGGVVGAVGGVAQALHGVEVVLALQGVDLVVACVERAQLQVLVEALAECLVGNGLVPVLIRGAVGVVAGIVEEEAVAELLGALLAQLAVVPVVGVVGDGGQGGLHQIDLVQLTVLVQLVADVHIAQHGHGEALKAAHVVGAVVAGVGDVALGVALNILLHDVGTAVPHGGVVAGAEALDAQLVDQVLSSRVEAVVGGHGIEIGAGVGAGEHQSVIIRCFHADAEAQHILVGQVGGSVAQLLGVCVVVGSAHHVVVGHGGVVGLVLVRVHDPLKAHQEVLAGQVGLHLAVDIDPIDIVAQVERPDGGVLVVLPAGSNGGCHLAVAVKTQQAVPQVGDDIGVGSLLGVQHVPALQLAVGGLKGDVLAEGCTAGGVGGSGAGSGRVCGAVVGAAAATCGQQAGCADDARALEEAAAVKLMRFKIDAHWNLILPDLYFPIF